MPDLASQVAGGIKPQAVIFGAGNIGRGFIGQLFSESGYQVTFIDIDQPLLDALNARHSYTIQLVTNEKTELVEIGPVGALHSSKKEAVAEVVSKATIGATAVGARVLEYIAPLVAAGMVKRAENGVTSAINLIVCENLKGAAAVFRDLVNRHLPPAYLDYAQSHLGLVDTVIGRMVPPPTPEMRIQDPSLIMVEPYKELPVDRQAFIDPIPVIVGMQPSENFPAYTARKLYIHNCGHAVLAYLGYLKGYIFGYEALEDPAILAAVHTALDESKAGCVAEYGVQASWLDTHIADLLVRFANRALGDTVFRLGRDPLRKLSPSDRLIAPARLAEKAGTTPHGLARSIAAALRFAPAEDPIAIELQNSLSAKGLGAVLQEVCAIQPDEPLARLVREAYDRLDRDK